MYSIYPKSKFFQKIEPFYWAYQLYDTVYNMWESFNLVTFRMRLPRNTQFRLDGLLAQEVYLGQQFNNSGSGFQGQSQLAKSPTSKRAPAGRTRPIMTPPTPW